MVRPLGKLQLERLAHMTALGRFLVVADDRVSKSLARRGLTKSHGDRPDSFHHITPNGLRAVADAMEAGLLEKFTRLPPPKRRG